MTDIDTWMDAATRFPLLPTDEVLRLSKVIQSPNSSDGARTRAVQKIVRHNLRLIPRVVRQVSNSKCSYNFGDSNTVDLLQQGVIGLQRAAEKYDPTRGYAFSTYAMPWIKQAVRRFANFNYSSVRVPENTLRDYFKVRHSDGNDFDVEDEKVRERLYHAYNALSISSLDGPCSVFTSSNRGEETVDWHEAIATDEKYEPDNVTTFQEILGKCVLEDRQVEALRKKFYENSIDSQIAKEMGISRSQVGNICRKAILKLRKYHCVQ